MRLAPAVALAAIWTLIPCSIASLGAAGTPLIDAVRSRDADRVRSLVKARADVNAPQGDGSTALHWAVHLDDTVLVDYLIESRRARRSRERPGRHPALHHLHQPQWCADRAPPEGRRQRERGAAQR